jgi:endonuclease-3
MTQKQRYKGVIDWFEENMSVANTELHFANTYQLLVAVMLSAQCTDKRVNMVTPALFEAFPTVKSLAKSTSDEVFQYIKSVSYPNSKAKHLVDTAKMLIENFAGEIPQSIEELQTLPGVGRKTANVIVSVAFNQNAMPVDTHVFRVSNRLGLTKTTTPLATEKELVKNIPEYLLGKAHHWILLHGRYVCTARKPHCSQCGLTPWCKYYTKVSR